MDIDQQRNTSAARNRSYKLLNWRLQVPRIERYFKTVSNEAKEKGFFERLYVMRNDDNRLIKLFAGQHSIARARTSADASEKLGGTRLIAEHGAELVLSQSVVGEVAVVLYPYTSERHCRTHPKIVWRVFSDPTHVTESVLNSVTRDFFRYIRVSSALFSESRLDRLRIRYLELRGRKYTDGENLMQFVFSHWTWLLGSIGSIATIYTAFK